MPSNFTKGGSSGDSSPIGAVVPAFRSGDLYKAVGEVVSRAAFPALSASFPRNGSLTAIAAKMQRALLWGGVAYGNGVFVAVGAEKSVGGNENGASSIAAYSSDGITWYDTTLPNLRWVDVVFANGIFVALASGTNAANGVSLCATSADGINWTQRNMPASKSWRSIAYGKGLFVATCNEAGSTAESTVAATSADGVTWTARTMPTASLWRKVLFNGTIFLAVASNTVAATSTDGINWTTRAYPSGLVFVGAGGKFVCLSGAQISTSTDGINWIAASTKLPFGQTPTGANYADGVYVAFINYPNQGSVTPTVICTSFDGVTWKIRSKTTGTSYAASAVGPGFILGLSVDTDAALLIYAEDLTTTDSLYLSGQDGQFVRVK